MPSGLVIFFQSIWSDWVSRFSGIISVVLVTLVVLIPRPLSRWSYGVTAIACLLVTVFRVWQKEYSARVEAETSNEGLQRYTKEMEVRHSEEANRLRQESKCAVARIGELQRERNDLERERNSLEKIPENIKRPLVSGRSFVDTSKTS